jgi:hypothetical protein
MCGSLTSESMERPALTARMACTPGNAGSRLIDVVRESRNVGHDGSAAPLPFEVVGFAIQVD